MSRLRVFTPSQSKWIIVIANQRPRNKRCAEIGYNSVVHSAQKYDELAIDGRQQAEQGENLDGRNTDFLTRFVQAALPSYMQRWLGVSDVVQSVILRLLRHRGRWQFGSQQQFEAWAVAVAKNRIADGIRRYKLNARFLMAETIQRAERREILQSQQPASSLDQTAINELTERLLAAIQALPNEIQDVVLLRYAHDCTFQQISEELNIPVTTCRRRWQEGCLELGQKLKDCM